MNNLKQKLLNTGIVEENLYLNKYIELIDLNQNTNWEKFKTQKHHIIPRYWFREKNLKIDNSKNNIVNLPYAEHLLAHYYLALCASNTNYRIKATKSLLHMNAHNYDLAFIQNNLSQINTLYDEMWENQKGKRCAEETKKKISQANKDHQGWNKGKHLTDEHKRKISEANKGKIVTEEVKLKISNALKGYGKGIPKPITSQKLKGRVFTEDWKEKISKANKGKVVSEEHKKHQTETWAKMERHWYHNDSLALSKMFSKEDIIPEGFEKGRKLYK